jgi:hypothetical protein
MVTLLKVTSGIVVSLASLGLLANSAVQAGQIVLHVQEAGYSHVQEAMGIHVQEAQIQHLKSVGLETVVINGEVGHIL